MSPVVSALISLVIVAAIFGLNIWLLKEAVRAPRPAWKTVAGGRVLWVTLEVLASIVSGLALLGTLLVTLMVGFMLEGLLPIIYSPLGTLCALAVRVNMFAWLVPLAYFLFVRTRLERA